MLQYNTQTTLLYLEWSTWNYHLHAKVHDWAIVVWQVQVVSLEFLKVPQPICWKLEKYFLFVSIHLDCCWISSKAFSWFVLKIGIRMQPIIILYINYMSCNLLFVEISFSHATPLSCPFAITPPNVWPHDSDIFVPVKAGLLMHKAQGMHEFMGNHSSPEAVRALQIHGLSSTTRTKVGPTPGLTHTHTSH